MQRIFSPAIALVATGMMLLGNAQAQQVSATSTPQSSSKNAQTTPAAKSRRPAAKSALTLTTPKDKISYAIGMNIGTTLHRDSMDIDPTILARGVRDALAGGKMLLTEDEAHAVLMQAQQHIRLAEEQKIHALGEANKAEGAAFLAANRDKEGVVTLPSGLQYKILQQGTGPKPALTDIVTFNYRGMLLNGKEFDSSYKRGQPLTFPVARLTRGWTEALQLMPVGSKWELYVPADLAYGERGAGADIGPNATLIFDVELLSTKSQAQPQVQPGLNNPAAAPPGTPQNQNQQQSQPGSAKPPSSR